MINDWYYYEYDCRILSSTVNNKLKKMNNEDPFTSRLIVETFTNSGNMIAMTITHMETGLIAKGIGHFRCQLYRQLLNEINKKYTNFTLDKYQSRGEI